MAYYFLPAGIRFNDYLFSEPVCLSGWRSPGCPGVVAILARSSQWAPKPLQPLYFGEFGNNAAGTLAMPRIPDNTRLEDMMVSVLPMPFSTMAQRRAICKELIAAYNPTCQADGRAMSPAEMAFKIGELEARQQEQSQQILSLLTYIGKLFEPQPVAPRRPIGFLPQMLPAEARTTESGS
jgi:hypothetical protein